MRRTRARDASAEVVFRMGGPAPVGDVVVVLTEAGIAACAPADTLPHAVSRTESPASERARFGPLLARIEAAFRTGETAGLPLDLRDLPPFQAAVLRATATIPPGEVRTYGELATMAGRPRAARAAGAALARNPIPFLVPCHRVVPAAGGTGNYGLGPELKGRLLALEGAVSSADGGFAPAVRQA